MGVWGRPMRLGSASGARGNVTSPKTKDAAVSVPRSALGKSASAVLGRVDEVGMQIT